MLLTVTATSLLVGCATREYGNSVCLNLTSWQDRADCQTRNKRVFDEFDKTEKKEPLSLKNAAPPDDALCYKNPAAGEKPCAATPLTGK